MLAVIRLLRHAGGLISTMLLLFCALLAVSTLDSRALIEQTIEGNRQVEAKFLAVAEFVEELRRRHQRLPTAEELEDRTPPGPLRDVDLLVSGVTDKITFYDEAVAQLGTPAEGSYFLGLWRGEWMDYYAAWSGETTLTFEGADHYLTGSRFADFMLYAIATAFFGYVGWRFWA